MSQTSIKNNTVSNKAMEWMTIGKWLNFSKIFFIIGAIVFTITTLTGSTEGVFASYSYMTVGVLITMFMVSIMSSMIMAKNGGVLDIIKTIAPLLIPGGFLLIPLGVLIYIFYTTGHIMENNSSNLPPIFYKINIAAFISILMQAFLLTKFYENEILSYTTRVKNNKKWMYISGLILTGIITCAISVELYVIIKAFLTDG